MKEVRRSKQAHKSSSSSSDSESSDYNSSSPDKKVNNGFDVFEFDEYDDIKNNATPWNLIQSRNKNTTVSRSKIPENHDDDDDNDDSEDDDDDDDDSDDDESELPLSVLRKKYKSDKPKEKNHVLKVMVNKQPKPTPVQKQQNKRKIDNRSSNSKRPRFSKTNIELRSPVKGKETQVKHGRSTEKQILREKIKSMLLAADWTIDYRPRRNRDYMDAVYISPTGTGYWSIVKAYDAFQKEEEDNSNDGGKFTPLPDEILGKLTRQTQKKIEREVINKRKGDNNEEEHGRKSRKIDRCTLLVRGFDDSEYDGFVAYSGKRTLLSWLIESGVVRMSEPVEYMTRRKTRVMQKGSITKDGIRCGCCSKIVTALKFEQHAGSKLGQPFQNLIMESGKSLIQCQIDAWNKLGELEKKGFYNVDVDGDDPNDDTCGICGDGGDLICCDGCPSTFHQTCLNIQMLPQGDWHCPNCSCKYCELAVRDCTEVGAKTKDPLLICCLCQKKYHKSCRPEIDDISIESSYPNMSFCEHKCHELHSHMQKLVGLKHELDSGFSWSLIHRSDLSKDASTEQDSQQVECNSMLAVAMSVMDECFLPFTDRRSGTNLIRNVVFNCGSNLSRLNYSSFFTAILEREDEVICAASIRVHGMQLAEMPFIGTRHIYRCQGICRRLLSAIESALGSLEVEKLVIPAVAEHMHTWTNAFGFRPLEESHKQELKSLNMVVFPGIDMLQKPLVKQDNPSNAISKDKITDELDDCLALSEKSELISSDEKDYSDKTATRDSGSEEPSVLLDDASKEILSVISPVKDDEITNRPEMVFTVKTADTISHPAEVPDVSCDPKPAVSVESSLQEQGGNSEAAEVPPVDLSNTSSSVIHCQLPGKELLSTNRSDTNIEDEIMAQNGNATNLIPTQDPNVPEQIGMQNGDGGNIVPPTEVHDTLPSHPQVRLPDTKSSFCVDLQNGCDNTTDVISHEAQVPPSVPSKTTVSSDNHLSPCESSDAPHIAERLEKSCVEFSGIKEGLCEIEK